MDNEHIPSSRSQHHVEAGMLFDSYLESLIYPITREGLADATKQYLMREFEYCATMAETRVQILDDKNDLPQAGEIEGEQESLIDMLKVGLLDRLPEEYMALFGREEFDEWIGPFLDAMLRGHIAGSESYEHSTQCPDDRFCSARIVKYYLRDKLTDGAPKIHENHAQNEGYLVYPDETVYVNLRIVSELRARGVYNDVEFKKLSAKYRDWLDSISDVPFEYHSAIFDEFAI